MAHRSTVAPYVISKFVMDASGDNLTSDRILDVLTEDNGTGLIGPEISRPTLDRTCVMYNFIIEAVVMGFLCLFGYTGNTLSMICLSRERSKTATPFLLVSLEVADTLFLIAVFLVRVAKSVVRYTDWEYVMPAFPYIARYVFPFALTAETGTIYLTVLVTVNRYISVCRPYEAASLCSVKHARKHVVAVTIFCILYNMPRFFERNITQMFDPHRNRTVNVAMLSDFAKNHIYQIVYTNIMYFIVMFLVPLVSLIILNSRLIKALRKTKKKRAQMLNSSSASMQSRSEDDITLVLIVVVLVFVVCQTPALITQLLLVLLPDEERGCPSPFFYYERISDLLVVANSSINFWIYCFCSNKFRHILRQLVCGKQCVQNSPEVTTIQGGGNTRVPKETQAICDSIGPEGSGDDEEHNKKDGTQDSLL